MERNKAMSFLNLLWLFTILYFCFGKFNWSIPSYFLLIFFVFCNYFAVNLGYGISVRKKRMILYANNSIDDKKLIFNKYKKFFIVACVATITFQIIWVVTFLDSFSFINVFNTIGDNYFERMEVEFNDVNIFMQMRTLFWVLTYFVYPIGFMFFKEMSLKYKCLFITTVIIEIFASLNMGVSKNIGDLFLILIMVIFLKNTTDKKTDTLFQMKKKRKNYFKVGLLIIFFLLIFSLIQNSRDDVVGYVENPFVGFATIRENSFFENIFGKNSALTILFDKIGYYLSHGYAGLAYALELPFENTMGLGFSNSMLEYAIQYFGFPSDLMSATYNYRLNSVFGWKDGQWWSTSFVRIGNSVSLLFVPVIMYLLGYLFGKAENEWREKKDVISLVFECQLFIGFVYASCNFQIFQGRQALIATFCLLFVYFVKNVLHLKITVK